MPKVVVDNTGFGDWTRELIVNDKGRLMDLRENAYLIAKHHPSWKGHIRFDEFAQRVVLMDKVEIPGFPIGEWTTQHDLYFGLWCAQIMKCSFKSERTIAQGVQMAAGEAGFHPVRDWIKSLRWDETPRLEDWLTDCLGIEKSPYAMRAGKYFVLNLIARVFEPGCICRSVPVLEGTQNRGKSESLRALAEPWFADSHLELTDKDSFMMIQGVWLNEIPEMHAFSRADVSRVKEFISSREDNFRPPYGGRVVRPKRQVVFAGTTNDSLYLRDWTGNTRYWPLKTETAGEIDADKVRAVREQLFAEGYALFKKGERRHPTREEELELFAPEQEERAVEHPWKAIIERWLDPAEFGNEGVMGPNDPKAITVREILIRCLKFDPSRLNDRHEQDVGRIMSALGYSRKRESRGERRSWYYTKIDPIRPKGEIGT